MEISERKIENGPKALDAGRATAKPGIWKRWLLPAGLGAALAVVGCSSEAVQDYIPIPKQNTADAGVDSGKTTQDADQETKSVQSDGGQTTESGSAIESDGGSGTEVNVAGIDAAEDGSKGVGSINPQDGSATDAPGSVSDTALANAPDLASVKTFDAENPGVDVAPDQKIPVDASAVDASSKANDGSTGEAGGTTDAYAVDSEGPSCQGTNAQFKGFLNLDQPVQYGTWTITYKGIVASDAGDSLYDLSFACGGQATDQLLPGGVSKIGGQMSVNLTNGGRGAVFATISSN